jgi:hypothetical protein
LKGTVLTDSVRLEFGFSSGGKTKLTGFNVYRRPSGNDPSPLPINAAQISQNIWEDRKVEFNHSYRYSVAALVELEGETVESLRSEETELLFTQQELR